MARVESFLPSANEDNLRLFCQVEEAVQSHSDGNCVRSLDDLRGRLQSTFPSFFDAKPKAMATQREQTNNNPNEDIQQLMLHLRECHRILAQKRAKLNRDRARLRSDKQAFARERGDSEHCCVLADSRPSDLVHLRLKSKYDRLKDKYTVMKREWGSERTLLLAQIDDLERRLRLAGDGSSSRCDDAD
jgi:hypothetical protein